MMEEDIQQKLTEIASKENIQLLLAVESGSRGWGFPSADSDYDVRAIFIRHQEDYLQIFQPCENISFIENQWFDVSCWDIRKVLRLILKSNMTLFEWLQSPVVYQADALFQAEMLTVAREFFQPIAALQHYRGIAKNTLKKLDFSDDLKLKTWLYFFRALLAADWVGQEKGIPPMTLSALMIDLPPNMIEQVNELIAFKAEQKEISKQKLPAELILLSQRLWQQVAEYSFPSQRILSPTLLNQFFQQTLSRLSYDIDY